MPINSVRDDLSRNSLDKVGQDKCISCARKISFIGLWDSLLLAVFKGIVGILTHSRALTASALYSVHDVISALAVLIGMKLSSRPVDEEHPYGYGNIEYIVSVFTSLLILGGTIFIFCDSIKIIFRGEHLPPHWAAFGAAVISLFTNEIIYRYNICAVKHINSPSLLAHAQHHRADVISSFAVVAAIIGGKFGFYFLDAVVAIFETVHLTHLSAEILYHGSLGLMDRSLDPRVVSNIRKTVSKVSNVKEVRNIRTRQIGRFFWVDLDICFPVDMPINEVSRISDRIRKMLFKKIRYLENINIIYV